MTQFQPLNGEQPGVRVCQSCWGSGLERCDPKERGKAAAELAQYLEPKRKAIDHTSSDGSMRPSWEVQIPQQPLLIEAKVISETNGNGNGHG